MSKKGPEGKQDKGVYGEIGSQVQVSPSGVVTSLPAADDAAEFSLYGAFGSEIRVPKDGKAAAAADPIYGDHPAAAEESVYGDPRETSAAAFAELTKPLKEKVKALSQYFAPSQGMFLTYKIGQNEYCFDNPICEAMVLKSNSFTPLKGEDQTELERLIENAELRAIVEAKLAPSGFVTRDGEEYPYYKIGELTLRFDSQTYPNEIVFREAGSGGDFIFSPIREEQRPKIKAEILAITNAPPRPAKPSVQAATQPHFTLGGDDDRGATAVSAPDPTTGSVKNAAAEAAAARANLTKNNPFL